MYYNKVLYLFLLQPVQATDYIEGIVDKITIYLITYRSLGSGELVSW